MSLIQFLEEHGGAVEADFQRYYNTRLSDLFNGKLSWRRLKILIDNLPIDSQTTCSVYGDKALWGTKEELLAICADALIAANWQRGGGKGRRPKPINRPYDDEEKTTKAKAALARAEAKAKSVERKDALSQKEFDKLMFGVG